MAGEEVQVRLSAQGTEDIVNAFRKVTEASNKAKAKIKADAEGMSGAFAGISAQLTSMAKVLTVGFIVRELVMFAKEALNTAAEVGRLAENVGYSAKTISVLNFALERNGRTIDQAAAGLRIFGRHMQEVEQHSGRASESVGKLFGDRDALKGLGAEEAFKKTITQLSKMQDGLEKTAILQNLFGRAGDNLSVVFNDMARNGGELETKLRGMGLLMGENLTDAARAAYAAMEELKGQFQGMATQTIAGLSESIIGLSQGLEEFNRQTNEGTSASRTFGSILGDVLRGAVAGLDAIFTTLSAAVVLLSASVVGLAEGLGTLLVIGQQISEYDFSGAKESAKDYFKTLKSQAAATKEQVGLMFDELGRRIQAEYDPPKAPPRATVCPKGFHWDAEKKTCVKDADTNAGGSGRDYSGISARASADAELSALESARKDQVASQRLLNEQLKVAYDEGKINQQRYFEARSQALADALISEQFYYTRKIEIQKRINAAEIREVQGRAGGIDAAQPGGADKLSKIAEEVAAKRLSGEAKINALIADRARLEIGANEKQLALDDERYKAERDRATEIAGLRQRIAKENANEYQAEIAAVEEEADKLAAKVGAEGAALVQQFRDAGGARADKNQGFRNFDNTARELQLKREEIALEVQAGTIFPAAGAARERSITAEYLGKLQGEINALELLNLTEPKDVERLAALKIEYGKLANSVNEAGLEMAKFKAASEQIVTSQITGFFDAAIDGSKNLGEAFRNMAIGIVKDLAKMAVQALITKAIMRAFSFFGGGGAAGSTAGNTFATSGFAEGGPVVGPGTGTSDSINARLSNGEYVVNADATAANLGWLHAINYGSRSPNLPSFRSPNFADGGLAQSASGGGHTNVTVATFIDPAQVAAFMKSPEGNGAILHVLSENPTTLRRVINS